MLSMLLRGRRPAKLNPLSDSVDVVDDGAPDGEDTTPGASRTKCR